MSGHPQAMAFPAGRNASGWRRDLQRGILAVEIPGHVLFVQLLVTAQLGFNQTTAVVTAPFLPQGPAEMAASGQDFITRARACQGLSFLRTGITAAACASRQVPRRRQC